MHKSCLIVEFHRQSFLVLKFMKIRRRISGKMFYGKPDYQTRRLSSFQVDENSSRRASLDFADFATTNSIISAIKNVCLPAYRDERLGSYHFKSFFTQLIPSMFFYSSDVLESLEKRKTSNPFEWNSFHLICC